MNRPARCWFLSGHGDIVNDVAWSPLGTYVASCSEDGSMLLWNTKTWQLGKVLEHGDEGVTCAAWSADETQIASGTDTGAVRVWSTLTFRPSMGTWHNNAAGRIFCLAQSPQQSASRMFVAVHQEQVVVTTLCGHKSCNSRCSFRVEQNVLPNSVDEARAAWSPDGAQIVTGDLDGNVKLWQVSATAKEATPTVLYQHNSQRRTAAAWSPDGTKIASAVHHSLILWDLQQGRVAVQWNVDPSIVSDIECVAWSPDSKLVALCGGDHIVRIFDGCTGDVKCALRVGVDGDRKHVTAVSWAPNGKQLAFAFGRDAGIWTLCSWSPKNHRLFSPRFRACVLRLMCVRQRLSSLSPDSVSPKLAVLPLEIWLEVIACLEVIYC